MEHTREHLEQQPKPSRGVAGDVQRLKSGVSSSAEELREFISNFKGRSPQEFLGAVSETGLFQGVLQATFGCLVLLTVLTVGPWLLKSDEVEATAASTDSSATAAASTAEASSESEAATADTAVADTQPASDDAPTQGDAAQAARAMKIDETITSDPDKNPLDGNLDKLLDGLD